MLFRSGGDCAAVCVSCVLRLSPEGIRSVVWGGVVGRSERVSSTGGGALSCLDSASRGGDRGAGLGWGEGWGCVCVWFGVREMCVVV